MSRGIIIVLDGSTSAGKTTLARCLQGLLDEPFWHLPIDAFGEMLPAEGSAQRQAIPTDAILSGYHSCIAALAMAGSNVIVDTGILEKSWLSECVALLAPFQVLFVGVSCPMEELERREQKRGDRSIGYARSMAERVHRHGLHDLMIDTSANSPIECAILIQSALKKPASISAFQQMHQAGIDDA